MKMTTGFEGLPPYAKVHSIDPESCVILQITPAQIPPAPPGKTKGWEVDEVAKRAGFRFENHGRGPTLSTELWLYTPAM